MNFKKMTKKFLLSLIVLLAVFTLVGCGGDDEGDLYTYNTYTTISPSNWNELTYQDNNDTQIMSYIGSSFFSYNFKYDEKGEILPGEFVMEYSAATNLEDVTEDYIGEEWGIPEGATARAYKITLREDLKWDDGTPIDASDFVYTMQEQLNPKFQNYRADSFYLGATIIHNAQNYVKQGTTAQTDVATVMANKGYATIADFLAAEGTAKSYVNWDYSFGDTYENGAWTGSSIDEVVDSKLSAADLYALFSEVVVNMWGYDQATADEFFVGEAYVDYTFPTLEFDKVGIFVGDTNYEIVLVLDKSLPLLKEDGTLSYQAAYNMSSLPLVHKEKYEANKVEPSSGTTLWTSTYNSSVETTASWGPYKLESFQSGKQYVLVRNENWYGYNMEQYKGQYQTDRIVCDNVAEWNAAWLKFLAGEIDGIGIDVTVADDYKGSDRAYFTPDDFVASLQLQSNADQLKAREKEGQDKEILTYTEFRKALSLAINRADFANKTTTSSLAGFGLFNSMHYYDVENGGVFRNTDEAKLVLCEIYNVNPADYDSLDDAVDAITGYDLDEARKLVDIAYDKAVAAGQIDEDDVVFLTMGSGAINETVTRRFNYISDAWKELVKGTKLEGRLETETKDFSDAWATDFRLGKYDVCMGGWTGAAWDPGYFLLAYLSPAYMYSTAWPTDTVQMTFTMKGVAEDGGDITETMTLLEWYDCLNGAGGAKYDWSATALEQSQRLQLIAALEKEVLKVYYTVPLYNNFSASLLSYKVDYVTYEYNTFLGYGGVRYMTFNYTDAEWAKVIADNNGELNYK